MDGFRYDVHLMSQSVPQEFLDELYAIPGNRVSLRYLIEQLEKTGVTVVAGSGISVNRLGTPVVEASTKARADGGHPVP